MRVAIALPTLSEGDAVGNDVFGMGRTLRARGADVAYFAWNGVTSEPVRPPGELKQYIQSPDDVLIYHHSIGCEWGVKAALSLNCQVAVKYHNVTPPEFFLPENREVAEGCRLGQKQVGELARSRAAALGRLGVQCGGFPRGGAGATGRGVAAVHPRRRLNFGRTRPPRGLGAGRLGDDAVGRRPAGGEQGHPAGGAHLGELPREL